MYKRQGKKIGVQLGTTGDQLATEYEQNDGSTVERFNKGADAIQALKLFEIKQLCKSFGPTKVLDHIDEMCIRDSP